MPSVLKCYRIFIASPEGLEKERDAFKETVSEYNICEAVPRGVSFTPVGWKETLGGVGRPQSFINKDVETSDYFVIILWDQWGSSTDKEGEGKFSSGTVEEYNVALDCFNDPDKPMRQIVVFFKGVSPRQLSDPGSKLQKVLEFKKELQSEKKILYHTFDVVKEFENILRRYLGQWVREQGLSSKVDSPEPPPRSDGDIKLLDFRTAGFKIDVDETYTNISLINEANKLADEGKNIEAEALYAKAVITGNDMVALNSYGSFLLNIGRLAQAEITYGRVLELSESKDYELGRAVALGNLGLICQMQGDLEKAERMFRKALGIHERLGRQDGISTSYSNLGFIYQTRGDLDKAEGMFKMALEIDERLGRQDRIASNNTYLGLIYRTRGDLDLAEDLFNIALKINKRLDSPLGIAESYGNLGLIHLTRSELDKAEEM
ncbi:MAG: tetratricopeptide repeat protein [Desulfobacteraceae bacterium]|nr:tetratricopeptide repeat protein [Desulfobacteraceae bacterium]